MKRLKIISLLLLLLYSINIYSNGIYVNASSGDDNTGNGSQANPYRTITKALDVSSSAGDSIIVSAGTYNLALGEIFPIEMKSDRILISNSGAASAIIDAAGSSNRVFNCIGNSNATIIEGFTITGGMATETTNGSNSQGGGIYCSDGDQTIIQRNIITGNTAKGYDFNQVIGGRNGGNSFGGGIYISGSSPTIINNVISYNKAQGGGGESYFGGFSGTPANGGFAVGGGIDATFAGTTIIFNNTFYGNQAIGGPGGVTNNGVDPQGVGGDANAGALSAGSNAIARNNIFSNNEAIGGTTSGSTTGESNDGAITCYNAEHASFNLYYNNAAVNDPDGAEIGSDNVSGDPLFISTSNFHLSSTASPAYHAGTSSGAPGNDLDGTLRGMPPTLGAYEGTDPLPVELVSFKAAVVESGIKLIWRTATEMNNYGFEIERNENNQGWRKISFTAGHGTTSKSNEYVYLDIVSNGKYKYRLKQIDLDGSFDYSPEIEVTLNVPLEFSLEQNYPNPFNPSTKIKYTVPLEGNIKLNIVNTLGEHLKEVINSYHQPGTYELNFDASGLSSGTYFYRLISGSSIITKKMVLVR